LRSRKGQLLAYHPNTHHHPQKQKQNKNKNKNKQTNKKFQISIFINKFVEKKINSKQLEIANMRFRISYLSF
jgi:hypothetical protein